MKKLLILVLLSYTFSSTLLAKNLTQTIHPVLKKKLCDQLAHNANRCDNGSTLSYHTHKSLTNGKLLIFMYLDNHTPKMYDRPDALIPVILDQRARWTSTVGENIIDEDIQSIHQDPHGNIWVRTLWQIEGVYPAFYHSKSGLSWKRTVLPKNREVDCCFEYVEKPIFLFDSITLTFKNENDENAKSWSADYLSAMSNNPLWRAVKKVPSSSIENLTQPNWKVTKTKTKITFSNLQSNKKIFLPLKYETNKKIYRIQIGAYAKKSSAEKVQKTLSNIPYYKQIVKGKKYTKLFVGEFTTLKKAKIVLARLKREHPKNKGIQKAFVLSTKP